MKKYWVVFYFLMMGIFMYSCEEKAHLPIGTLPEDSTKPNLAEFTDPVFIIVNTDSDSYKLNNPKLLEPYILKANELSVDISFVPKLDLRFTTRSGKEIILDKKTLSVDQIILFNGKEILLTTSEGFSIEKLEEFMHEALSISDSKEEPYRKIVYNDKPVSNSEQSDSMIMHRNLNKISGFESKRELKKINLNNNTIDKVLYRNPFLNSFICTDQVLNIALDNDLFNNTDRYYTNGIKIKYQSPAFAFWKINSLLPISERNTMEYNSLEIHHAMFTPFTTKNPPLLKDDRPYASTLMVRFVRKAENPEKGTIQKASIDIGVIGQAALGSLMQEGVHASLPSNDEPLGWETQIANDIILNYNYELIQKLFSAGILNTYSRTAIAIGTLNTDFTTGLGFKIGREKYFLSPLPDNFNKLDNLNENRFDFSLQTNFWTAIVGYNATLNGGLLNKNNIYVLEPHEIERLLFNAEAILSVSYRKIGISLAQYFVSKEYKKGKNHHWGQIGLNFEF